jgi:hypothetical protein
VYPFNVSRRRSLLLPSTAKTLTVLSEEQDAKRRP